MAVKFVKLWNNLIKIFTGISLTSCCVIGYPEGNVTNQPEFIGLLTVNYELLQDVFLYKERGNKYGSFFNEEIEVVGSIGLPGTFSTLPYSVVEYERDPKNWKKTDTFATKYGLGKGRDKILGIVRAGTQFRVFKVRRIPYEPIEVYIKFLNGDFVNCDADGWSLLNLSNKNSLKSEWTRPL